MRLKMFKVSIAVRVSISAQAIAVLLYVLYQWVGSEGADRATAGWIKD
jgi:hypothetical protein